MMMYRQCTIIGMNKKSISWKEIIFIVVCFAAAIGIRLFFLLSGEMAVTDDFQYYQASMIKEQMQEPVMTSGIAFAYGESLSDILMFTGNRINVIAGYHIVLQTAIFLFMFLGCRFLIGKAAAVFEVLLLAFAPWMIGWIFQASPETFYLFGWAFVFLMTGIFARETKSRGWYRKNRDEFFLMLFGFLTGVVCIWHYMGLLLLVLIGGIIIANVSFLTEKRKRWKEVYAMESLLSEEEEDECEREEVMPVASQIFIIAAGIMLGGYCTLMKYTGVTGNFIKEQFVWWQKQLLRIEGSRWQDLSVMLPVWMIITILAGVGVQAAFSVICDRREREKDDLKQETAAEEEVKEEKKESETENRNIKYIENPLPLPKKHVKRIMDFENTESVPPEETKDDFDLEIEADDDFDI